MSSFFHNFSDIHFCNSWSRALSCKSSLFCLGNIGWQQKFDGEKDLFQIKYLKNEFESIDINSMFIINKY